MTAFMAYKLSSILNSSATEHIQCQMGNIIKRTLALDNLMQKMFQVRNEDVQQNMMFNMKEVFSPEKCKSKIYIACSKEIETKT